ncbi:hypothetical protein BT96DRAFT_965594 [Gymnopus androsaceus JB14]|uniref:Serine/threonine-protein kinase Tel1 n=1 Tax=Gymnopus androsaceus JB14 TaxID=1447944 RepID=A0A6A4HS24_9AGAR|nr:hypothetical protein BT96DRAFT_965594 [Gymnopus androsaceus JB14]
MADNLQKALEALQSTKIKERQDGLSSIRTFFTRESVLKKYSEKPPDKAWLPILNALATCIRSEKAACLTAKKSSDAAEKRLAAAAGTYRWFIGRIITYLNKKVLFPHRALDFIKALECVASHTPHLNRLEEQLKEGTCIWEEIVELAPINTSFTDGDTSMDAPKMFVEDSLTYDDDEDKVPVGTKRRRPTPRATQAGPSQPRPAAPRDTRFRKTISSEQSTYAKAALRCLETFLDIYPTDTSLHHDFLEVTLSTLRHVSLNKKKDVILFARSTWDRFLDLWGTKNKALKEGLVSILRMLFPFLIADPDAADSSTDAWMPFRAKTFRAGSKFDAAQAFTWAVLELQADCAEKLFQHFESVPTQSSPTQFTQTYKRARLNENPLPSLLRSIRLNNSHNSRVYDLQILLFFIDRHWNIIHDSVQSEIIRTLLEYVTSDDGGVQSWAFLCLAAVVYADCNDNAGTSPPSQTTATSSALPRGASTWDSVWTHAIRRTSSSQVCRAACHAASVLAWSHRPFDSVCTFLSLCLRVANQDVRLYRMQLEEKVLTWLIDSWKPGNVDASEAPLLYLVSDVLLLLETICASSQHSSLICRIAPPLCLTTETLVTEKQTRVIREFLLNAKLPTFQKDQDRHSKSTRESLDSGITTFVPAVPAETDLIEPRGRERKVSAFFLKCLESLLPTWQELPFHNTLPRADTAKRTLDVAVISLSFESVLVLDGIQSNRRVIQAACKLIGSIIPLLDRTQWTMEEKALILSALEPLVSIDTKTYEDAPWSVLLPPTRGTGIRTRTLKSLLSDDKRRQQSLRIERMKHLKVLWHNVDVQSTFGEAFDVMRDVLRSIMGQDRSSADMSIDDHFGGSGHGRSQSQGGMGLNPVQTLAMRSVAGICISFLSVGPLLQQASGEPTRDKDLTELMLDCAENESTISRFLLVCPVYFDNLRNQNLNLSHNHLDRFLTVLGSLIQGYEYAKNENFLLQLISFLDATLFLWISLAVADPDICDNFRQVAIWFSKYLVNGRFDSWRVRDAITRLCDRYLAQDPTQQVWLDPEEKKKDIYSPLHVLPTVLADADIRVRFRVAVISAHLFDITKEKPMDFYDTVRGYYAVDLDNFEHMVTRILSLGNIMVVSSSVRRGPYWHLVETCFHSETYNRHIETILTGVAQRMGLEKFQDLFEAYAYQLAYSIRQGSYNVLQLPVNILGFKDLKERALKTIRNFTPANLLATGPTVSRKHGRSLFEGHCAAIQKSTKEVVRECFGDIVGYQAVAFLDSVDGDAEQLQASVLRTLGSDDLPLFRETLKDAVDSVAVSILRTLDEQDFTDNGTIIQALAVNDKESARVFSELTKHRRMDDIDTHVTNLPNFGPYTVLAALSWLMEEVPGGDNDALTYHVMQELFAEVQRSFLVNEQISLVNAITLTTSFSDPTLLHTLIRGACAMLGQWDLVPAAQSILEWCLSLYTSGNDPRFPDIFIRVACLCHDHSGDIEDDPVAKKKSSILLEWLDDQAYTLSRRSNVTEQVKLALPAWPHEPSEKLYPIFDAIDPTGLSQVLSDKYPQIQIYDPSQFAQTDFWKLKECMPSVDQLREEDVHAFASLLVLNQGAINSFGNMLEDDGSRHAAYRTLRSLMLTISPDSFEGLSQLWPIEYRIEVSYLREFRPTATKRTVPELSSSLSLEEFIDAAKDFSTWISLVATLLADILSASNPFYAQLCSILTSHISFADKVLPLLVQTLLQSPGGPSHSSSLSRYFEQLLSSVDTAVSCRRSIINVVLHLRNIEPESGDALGYNKWLDISFLSLARNAIICGAYTTALLFLELDAEYRDPSSKDVSTEQIMYEIYSNIDEPDGFYAIRTQDHHQFLMRRFHHEKEWEKAFRFHGAALETDTGNAKEIEGLLQSFHSYGFNHIATRTLLDSDQDTNSTMAYQLGWRAETWDLPESKDGRYPGASLYLALRAVHRERDQGVTDAVIRHVLFKEMDHLRTLGSENIAQIREAIQTLMSLSQATQWRSPAIQDLINGKVTDLQRWATFTTVESDFQFDDVESIMATRISLIKSARRKDQRQQIGTMLSPFSQTLLEVEKQCLLRLSKVARDSHQNQVALNSVIQAKNIERSPSLAVTDEFSSVLWAHKEEKHAVEYLKDLQRDAKNCDPVWLAQVTARLGTWTAEACLEQPSFIQHEFFDNAISLISGKVQENEGRANVYHHAIQAALDSPDLIRLNLYRERKEKELEHYEQKVAPGRTTDKRIINQIAAVKKVLGHDNKAMSDFIANRDASLKQAIQMYSLCLQASDTFDEDVPIRLCSLWLSNFDNNAVQKQLVEALDRVPSRKLVFLAHQIFSRIDDKDSEAQKTLQPTIIRMCTEHPFHSRGTQSESPTSRAVAARDVFQKLLNNKLTRERTAAVEEICNASLAWAMFPVVQEKDNRPQKVPDNQPIRHLRLSRFQVPVMTAYTPIDITTRYDPSACVCVDSYANQFETAGGINLPKIINCTGSDGRKYKQLFKGKDDLRQDAVMEQVFDLVNTILRRDVETKRRNLYIRGYKVVPLSSQAGVLEFVGNTTPLRYWLEKAHAKYRPNDMKGVYKKLAEQYKLTPKGSAERVKCYLACMENFKPVMRHYFTETNKTPIAWFRNRLNYTRSVATTSIVGYILGLGDRHTNNILMDNIKGEIIHIDLGVAFDQGKLLPVPETVPFRMTPDMVDGMGISGTDGVFQRCAEETLRVLRDESDVIMTVLQVFRHDPLHNWTMSEYKMKKQVETDDSSSTTTSTILKNPENVFSERLGLAINLDSTRAQEDADRALMGVSGKLSKKLSAAAAVRSLLAEATDTYNLGTIWYGWGPYL